VCAPKPPAEKETEAMTTALKAVAAHFHKPFRAEKSAVPKHYSSKHTGSPFEL
jgi:hypothetical protein